MKKSLMTCMLAATAAAATLPQTAMADEIVEFRFAADELETEQGRNALLTRLKRQARAVCSFGVLAPYSTRTECRKDIEQQLIAAIDSPALSVEARNDKAKLVSAQN